jgi:hypothetical protein
MIRASIRIGVIGMFGLALQMQRATLDGANL